VLLEFAKSQGAARAETATTRYCNEGSTTACVTETRRLCTDGFCVTDISMSAGAVRKATAAKTTYALIPVTHSELSRIGDDPTAARAFNVGEIGYFEKASDSWKNSGQSDARVIFVGFR
jgi:hypothetical protein